MEILISNIITLIIVIVYSYLNEKGKNLALRQDITHLTKLVEEVKITFIKEVENLRFNNSINLNLITEERNSIIDINEKYFYWLHLILNLSFTNSEIRNNLTAASYKQKIDTSYISFINVQARFELFIKDEELIETLQNLRLQTLNLMANLGDKFLLDLEHKNIEMDVLERLNPIVENVFKYKNLLEERTQLFRTFTNKLLDNYKTIAPIAINFQEKCRNYLYTLSKPQNNISN